MKIKVINTKFLIEGKKTSCSINYKICCDNLKVLEPNRTATAYTTCNENDKQDANIGMKIALAKAEKRMYEEVHKINIILLKKYAKASNELSIFNNKAEHCIEHDTEYIKNLSNPIKTKENNENN